MGVGSALRSGGAAPARREPSSLRPLRRPLQRSAPIPHRAGEGRDAVRDDEGHDGVVAEGVGGARQLERREQQRRGARE